MKKTNTKENNEIIEIPAEEAPYALPDGWKWVRLGDFSTSQYGYSAKAVDDDKLPKMLRITDIQDNGVDWKTVPGCNIEDSKLAQYRLVDNDIVIARIGATTGKSFLIDKPPLNAVFASYLIRVRLSKDLLPKYVYFFLQSETYWKQISDLSSGIALPGVNSTKLQTMMFPLPPLETQKRIVERIESLFAKLDEAKEKAQTALDTFELRKSAILHKAFTGELTAQWREENQAVAVTSEHSDNLTSTPAERLNGVTSYSEDSNNITSVSTEHLDNISSVPSSLSLNEADADSVEGALPNSWRRINLQNVCATKITDGTHKTPTYCEASEGGIPFISSKDVTTGKICWDNIKYITPELHSELYARLAPQKDDVLLAKNGTTGVAALVDTDKIFDLYVTLAVLRPNKRIVLPKYLLSIVNSPICKRQFDEHLTGIGVPNLHLRDIKEVVIPVPPLPEQQEIVRILDDLLAKENAAKEAAEAVIEKIDLMKKSILARAFRGEL